MGGRARPIKTLLIANRGEIALRILRTAKRMGLRTVAIFSDADARAMHVGAADTAIRIGPAPARHSYLDIPAVIAAGREADADAIHPGYGFLAENAAFAQACQTAGMIFIGPPVSAIALMGDKAKARALAARAGVPVVRGYDGGDQTPSHLALAAREIGYPVMLKAAAGGGGKGMRIAASEPEFAAALEGARREAEAAFGDGRMIIERHLDNPRHIEVQIFADQSGNVVHLFERDCSIQRRHQKLIEETPAPGLSSQLQENLRRAAILCAKSCSYAGAGTVEFLVAGDHFYFMEMNTRLQVEHTVTEAITGLDLVEWQLRVASGEDLPLSQDEIAANGHAIEARLCAEDPEQAFLPQTGRLHHLRLPAGPGIRVDSGGGQGYDITVHYDSLIAKIVSHGENRPAATARLSAALAATEIAGVVTNRRLLAAIAGHPDFHAGKIDTGFLTLHASTLLGGKREPGHRILALAALAALRNSEAQILNSDPSDPYSPWILANGWRLGRLATRTLELEFRGQRQGIVTQYRDDGYELSIGATNIGASGTLMHDGTVIARIGDVQLNARVVFADGHLTVFSDGEDYEFVVVDPYRPAAGIIADAGHLTSPMPGTVVAVKAQAGQDISKGAVLVILEAMKMEHTITAPRDGRVKVVNVAAGDRISAGDELVVLEPMT